ncbi:MAG: bifunctional hydroxymethylpyrimidine kinase/phosphomethylpyrimidine kinase, partial [Bacteroidota bacterium]
MKTVVISYSENFKHETDCVISLFKEGLDYFHLRKPGISKYVLIRYLKKIPEAYHNRIIIYDHFELINEFNLKGIHFNRRTIELYEQYKTYNVHKSFSAHSIEDLKKYDGFFDYLLISPVFDSISKGGYYKQIDIGELKDYIQSEKPKSEIIALGGISEYNVEELLDIGIHGVALLGVIWKTYLDNVDFKISLAKYNLVKSKLSQIRPFVLSIAGFDPSGGAGLNADIKTFESQRVYGLSVCTSITYQNEDQFLAVDWMSYNQIIEQIDVLFEKYSIDYVKIGLIENLETLNRVIDYLKIKNQDITIIWDPILSSGTGFGFHENVNHNTLTEILNKIFLLTPNLEESKML